MIKKIPLIAFEHVPVCDECGQELALRQALWPRHLYWCKTCEREYSIDSEEVGVKFERWEWNEAPVWPNIDHLEIKGPFHKRTCLSSMMVNPENQK